MLAFRAIITLVALGASMTSMCGCGGTAAPADEGAHDAATLDGGVGIADGGPMDAEHTDGGGGERDASAAPDGGASTATLSDLRDALLSTYTDAPCATWAAFDASRRAVFLTITHRLFLARTPDGRRVLEHIDALHLVRGGGPAGSTCGGAENNRLFLSMDDYLWQRAVDTWNGTEEIDDGTGGLYVHTRDIGGPHSPFDASIESETGLHCVLLFEQSDSKPPTAQGHFFLDGSAVAVERGPDISLPVDPTMLEIDLDFNCVHDSNPTCSDFGTRYMDHYGDIACEWVPASCAPVGAGCFRSVTP